MQCTSAQALTRAEQYLAAGFFSEAETLASQIVRGEYTARSEDPPRQLATAFVIVQSLHHSGRLKELRSVVPRLYGDISNLPKDATLLWASLLVQDGNISEAKELLERHLLTRDSDSYRQPNLLAAASRLYTVDVLAKGQKDPQSAINWLDGCGSKSSQNGETSEQFLPQALVTELKAELSELFPRGADVASPVFKAASSSSPFTPVVPAERTQENTEAKGWFEWATNAVVSSLGLSRETNTDGENTLHSTIKDPQQALMYVAVAGTIAYCIVAERRTLYRFVRNTAGSFGLTQMAQMM
mmetsp:Transcript_38792/g.84420  ORF Transcript_38792/g.84420 Transcript_38792/m.84420 type:complete len:299 (+) Transcript_38792:128-1024(+)|eukprot:CAMPEP_0118946244 /NCGR_PEP_ID=MMETSP1169-20130426/43873_1 /TAXON_ID=36882 /ORGANISM="Pyramimonas obovata, Strain CCMP722" /LENGTH=298 /DNA_ID=CAMNT_0006892171 /DNA_START=101 /DNA_END=997 /DNA_ORIENTATION=+